MKLTLFNAFIFFSFWLFSQQDIKPYEVLSRTQGFTYESRLDGVDPMYFDLYRSKTVDNTVIVTADGQQIRILLLSADKMKSMGRKYNDGLVEKGAVMSGAAANQPRTFMWNVDEGNRVEDLTAY